MSFKFHNIFPKLQHITYLCIQYTHLTSETMLSITTYLPSSTGSSLVQPRCHLKNIVANFEATKAWMPPWQLTLNCPLGHAPSAGAKRCWFQTGHGKPLTCSGSHGYHLSKNATTRVNWSWNEGVLKMSKICHWNWRRQWYLWGVMAFSCNASGIGDGLARQSEHMAGHFVRMHEW